MSYCFSYFHDYEEELLSVWCFLNDVVCVDEFRDVEVWQRRFIYLVSVECIYLLFSLLCTVI